MAILIALGISTTGIILHKLHESLKLLNPHLAQHFLTHKAVTLNCMAEELGSFWQNGE